jgi:hypothetical protein
LKGTLTLTGDNVPSDDTSENCTGYEGYDDIGAGAAVTVYDNAGKVIAQGALGVGKPHDAACVFHVAVPGVPNGSKFYQPPRPANIPGTGSRSRTNTHSASLMSEPHRARRSGRSAAFPNRWARQSHPGVAELDPATTTTRHFDNRASCFSLDSTTASYQEALPSCPDVDQLTGSRPPFEAD